jgi:hypothetical protein
MTGLPVLSKWSLVNSGFGDYRVLYCRECPKTLRGARFLSCSPHLFSDTGKAVSTAVTVIDSIKGKDNE